MIRPRTGAVVKNAHPSNPNMKYYNAVMVDDLTGANRISKRKNKTRTEAEEYGIRLHERIYRSYNDRMGLHLKHSMYWSVRSVVNRILHTTTYIDTEHGAISTPKEVLLIDVSLWQGIINWVVTATKVAGAFIKASQGDYFDPKFARNWIESKRNHVVRGPYHFYDSRVAPKVQALRFWNAWKADIGELPVVADYEDYYGGLYSGHANFRIFLEELMKLSGLRKDQIIIYTGYYYWLANSPTGGTALAWFADFKLWLAWYTDNQSLVKIPAPWTVESLWFWQFGTPAWGLAFGMESLEVDADWWMFTLALYKQKFLNGGEVPTMIAEDQFYDVTAGTLNLRSSGKYDGVNNDLGAFNLVAGDVIHSIGYQWDGNSKYHMIDAIYRNGEPVALAGSPTGEYWSASTNGTYVWMVPTTYTPPQPGVTPTLLTTVFIDDNGVEWEASNVEMTKVIK